MKFVTLQASKFLPLLIEMTEQSIHKSQITFCVRINEAH